MIVDFYDAKPYDRQYFQDRTLDRIVWRFHETRLDARTAMMASGAKAVCLFVNDRADKTCLERLAECGVRLLALRSAGYNHVDLTAAKQLKLTVVRVPAYSPHAVAEHAVALFLTLNRKIHRAFNRVREHNFSLNGLVGLDVYGKTVGIIGTGKIGRITAQIFRGFDATVIAYDPIEDRDWAGRYGVQYRPFNDLLSASDIISLHLPLLPDTFHLLGSDAFSRMRPGAYLINTSRGKLVHTKALIQALKRGQLGGVALDVYEEEEGIFFEDLSDRVLQDDELSRLLSFPNVLVTSHQAFLTHEALSEIARVTTENLVRFDTGQPLLESTTL